MKAQKKVRVIKIRVGKLAVSLLLLCVLSIGLVAPALAQVVVRDSIDPILTLDSNMRKEDIVVGNEFTINFIMTNVTDKPAFNITLDFRTDDFDPGKGPFVLKTSSADMKVEEIPAYGTRTVPVVFEVSRDAQTDKEYRMMIKASYQNALFQYCGVAALDLSMPVTFDMMEPVIIVRDVKILQQDPDIEEGFDIELTLQNTSRTMDARNVVVFLDGDINFQTLDITNKQVVPRIERGMSARVNYKLKAKDSRTANTVKLNMAFDYLGSKSIETADEILNLPLPDDFSQNTANPRVIVNKYTLSKAQVFGGDRVTLTLHIENTNKRQVENVKISLGVLKLEENSSGGVTTTRSGGTVFSPVDSSNSFYIDKIEGQSVVTKTIELYVDPNAEAKTYIVPIEIVYEDRNGKDLFVEEMVNIPVTQEAKIKIVSSTIPHTGFIGQPMPVMADYVNAGKVALSSFMAFIEDEDKNFDLLDTVYYSGRLEIGVSDSYSGLLVPQKEGLLKAVLVFSYTDNNNQEARLELPFEIDVQASQFEDPGFVDRPPGMVGPDIKQPNSPFQFLQNNWLAFVMGLVALVELIIIIRAKRKSKEEFFNE